MGYKPLKGSFSPGSPGFGREYEFNQIGYWVGTENGKKVHAILLF